MIRDVWKHIATALITLIFSMGGFWFVQIQQYEKQIAVIENKILFLNEKFTEMQRDSIEQTKALKESNNLIAHTQIQLAVIAERLDRINK